MKNIEVELRSFITEEKYDVLMKFFHEKGEFVGKEDQETFYFDCGEDLRIQKNDNHAKIWMKKGNMHDDAREEIEIKVKKDEFKVLEKLFLSLGYGIDIKWYRNRNSFKWQGIDVSLDHTRGFGYILELEIMSEEKDKNNNLDYLRNKMGELGVIISDKEEFTQKFEFYKKYWTELVN